MFPASLSPGITILLFLLPVNFKANVSYLLHNYRTSQNPNMFGEGSIYRFHEVLKISGIKFVIYVILK